MEQVYKSLQLLFMFILTMMFVSATTVLVLQSVRILDLMGSCK